MVDPTPTPMSNKRKHSSSSTSATASASKARISHPRSTSSLNPSSGTISKFSGILDTFIDMDKIEITSAREWVRHYFDTHHKEDAALLEDIVFDRLANEKWPDPKVMQSELSDVYMFPKDAREFVKRLWHNLDKNFKLKESHPHQKRVRKD